MLNFHFHHNELKYNDTKTAKEYDEKQYTERALDENKKIMEEDSLDKPEDINYELEEMTEDI